MFKLVVHHTGEAWDGLLNVNFLAAVRLNDVGKAPGHCGVPAVNATAVPAPVAMALVGIHGFATYLPRCAFWEEPRRVGGGRVWELEPPGHGQAKTAFFCFVGVAIGLLEAGTSV